jgi:hypothetical protein
MTRRSLLLSIAVAGIAGAGAFGWLTIRRGFSARDNPSAIEKLVATTARQLAVPSHYRQLDGARHAADRCSALDAKPSRNKTDATLEVLLRGVRRDSV